MKRLLRLSVLTAVLALASLALPNGAVEAQSGGAASVQAPEAFVPSEKLPVDSAVAFPVDI